MTWKKKLYKLLNKLLYKPLLQKHMTLFHAREALGKSTLKSYNIMANNPTHCKENECRFYVQNCTVEICKDTVSAVHTAPAFRKELDATLIGISRAEICHPNVGQIWEGRNVFIHEDTIRTSIHRKQAVQRCLG